MKTLTSRMMETLKNDCEAYYRLICTAKSDEKRAEYKRAYNRRLKALNYLASR